MIRCQTEISEDYSEKDEVINKLSILNKNIESKNSSGHDSIINLKERDKTFNSKSEKYVNSIINNNEENVTDHPDLENIEIEESVR
jgi:hypothetical protein